MLVRGLNRSSRAIYTAGHPRKPAKTPISGPIDLPNPIDHLPKLTDPVRNVFDPVRKFIGAVPRASDPVRKSIDAFRFASGFGSGLTSFRSQI
jgi:hypothetical protein